MTPTPTTRLLAAGLTLAAAVLVTGCGRDQATRSTTTAPPTSAAPATTATTATTAATGAPGATTAAAASPSTSAPPTTAPGTRTTLSPADAAALDRSLTSVGSSLGAADTATRQADPDQARSQEGTAP